MDEPPEDALEELKRQLVRAWANEQECRKVAHGFKNLADKRDYLQQAEFYKQRAANLSRELETLLSQRG